MGGRPRFSLHSYGSRAAACVAAIVTLCCSACAVLPQAPSYPGPVPRPPVLDEYYGYDRTHPYQNFTEELITERKRYRHKQIRIDTEYGRIVIDLYQRHTPSKQLVFVFPVLGGENIIEGYFAKYFAEHGFDSAIVHRDKDFKKPEEFDHIEEIFRRNVVRDRIAMDFFQREYGKESFGSFGISRGAINAAVTAGVDGRLRHNVFAMGGSHLLEIFRHSDVPGITRYRDRVMKYKKITAEQFFDYLRDHVKTDPRHVAQFIDARHTLMFLSVFDHAVPFKYGMRLRRAIGRPKTVFILSGHYTSILYTQFVKLIPPSETFCIFPFDFVESQALRFYNTSFDTHRVDLAHIPFAILQIPAQLVGQLYYLFSEPPLIDRPETPASEAAIPLEGEGATE